MIRITSTERTVIFSFLLVCIVTFLLGGWWPNSIFGFIGVIMFVALLASMLVGGIYFLARDLKRKPKNDVSEQELLKEAKHAKK